MKIALNCTFGGFCLSPEVYKELGVEWDGYGYLYPESIGEPPEMPDIQLRSHPRLIAAIEAVGVDKAHRRHDSGDRIRVVEVPDNVVTLYMTDYDGREGVTWSMAEVHHA